MIKKIIALSFITILSVGCSEAKSKKTEASYDVVPKCSNEKVIALLDENFDQVRKYFFDPMRYFTIEYQTENFRRYKNFTTLDINSAKTIRKCQVESVYFIKRTKIDKKMNEADTKRIEKYPSLKKVGGEVELDINKFRLKDPRRINHNTTIGTYTIKISEDGKVHLEDIALLRDGAEKFAINALKSSK